MAYSSGIEWTEATWNPVTGCTKISTGCKFCYAELMAKRLQQMGQSNYTNGFQLTLQRQALSLPLRWKKPRTIFVNSMSDLFHKRVPLEYIQEVFAVMQQASQHRFQVLTKRSTRLSQLMNDLDWGANVWMGVTVESEDHVERIRVLRSTPARVKFLSLEPLLSPLPSLNLEGIDWVIVGGESGVRSRPMQVVWVRDLRDQCLSKGVPFFFKQWGGAQKKRNGRILDGRTWDEMPAATKEGLADRGEAGQPERLLGVRHPPGR